MNWSSPAEFFDMGGYGLFVWGSYGVCLLLMTLEPVLAARRRRQALADAAAHPDKLSPQDEDDQ